MFDPSIPYSRRDVDDGLADYIAIRSGYPPSDPDPVAVALARGGQRAPFGEVLAHLAGASYDPARLVRIFTQSDVGNAVGKALTKVAGIAYDEATSEIAPVLFNAPARGIRPVELPLMDLGEVTKVPPCGGPVPLPMITITSATVAAPALFAARFLVSRQIVVGDDIGVIDHAVRQLAGMTARIQDRLAAEALDAASIVTTSAVGLDTSALGEALALLRTRTTRGGNKANLKGSFLIVPPGKEVVARILVSSLSYGAQPPVLGIIVNPWLGTASYLLCAPRQTPVLARPMPVGDSGLPIVFPTGAHDVNPETGEEMAYDGLAIRFEQYIGVSVVDTTGAIKIPAS